MKIYKSEDIFTFKNIIIYFDLLIINYWKFINKKIEI